jgi:hypothetical protein
MKLFPKVQFIVTAHSPLFVMGMEQVFGEDGFRVIDMPSGTSIETETFSEFRHALAAFTRTRAFDRRLLEHIQSATKPVVLVEGKFDVIHLQVAWDKLYPGQPPPWDIVPSGGFSTKENRGSAEMLRTMIRACAIHIERPALGLFDHDEEGFEQLHGLKGDGFAAATDRTHWKHPKQPVHAVLLPAPSSREKFVSAKAKSCFLALEHYYSDELLKLYGLAEDPVVADSAVFGIVSDSKKKSRFAEAVPDLDAGEFANFRLLFDRLSQVFGVDVQRSVGSLSADQLPTQPSVPSSPESQTPV